MSDSKRVKDFKKALGPGKMSDEQARQLRIMEAEEGKGSGVSDLAKRLSTPPPAGTPQIPTIPKHDKFPKIDE
jgi:hypothetical protein